MKTIITSLAAIAFLSTLPVNAAEKAKGEKKSEGAEIEKTDLVPSGTYMGTAHKVDPGEKEVYVKTNDGKIIELYLKEHTQITKGDKKVAFSELNEGQKLEVKVERKGKKLDPLSVKIVD